MSKYNLINYFDVWGNEEEGYEVNNLCIEERDIVITDDATDKDILEFLVTVGFLNTSDENKVYLQDYGDGMIEIYQKEHNYPLGRLEAVSCVE